MKPWYEETFGLEYLDLYPHRDTHEARSDAEAIDMLVSPPRTEPLLDLGCGAGRHLLAFHELGYTSLTGIDLSGELLAAAKKTLAGTTPGTINLVRADMRSIPYSNHFATAISMFTSFGYFDHDSDDLAVLASVNGSLRPGGSFVLDYMNRDYLSRHLVAENHHRGEDSGWHITRCLTDGGRRVEKTTTVTYSSGDRRQFHESVRLYSCAEMAEMFRDAGLIDFTAYGALDGTLLTTESERLIITARKGHTSN